MPITFRTQGATKRSKPQRFQVQTRRFKNDNQVSSNGNRPAKTANKKPKKCAVKPRVKPVDERPKLHTKPRRSTPNPVPTPPRKPREPQRPEYAPHNDGDRLTQNEMYCVVSKLENLGSARTPNETALLKKLKRWKRQR